MSDRPALGGSAVGKGIDPCRLVRQVKQFERSEGERKKSRLFLSFFNPCRLVRQVKQFERSERERKKSRLFHSFFDPCRLVRQVKEFHPVTHPSPLSRTEAMPYSPNVPA